MSCVGEILRAWSGPRALAVVLIAAGAAGCSGDTTRFAENPYASKSPGEVTGSVPPSAPAQPQRTVQSAPLPPPSGAAPTTVPSGTAGGGGGMASYTPTATPRPAQASPEITGSVQAPPSGHWTWD